MPEKKVVSYILDVLFSVTQFPPGWLKPSVVLGRFEAHHHGQLQEAFFYALLEQGFKRTYWQLILPGQTAGLIKKVPPTPEGGNQFHIRFYKDGTIDCEFEAHNFSIHHFSGYRVQDASLLHQFVDNSKLPSTVRKDLKKLFGVKEFEKSPIRAQKRS